MEMKQGVKNMLKNRFETQIMPIHNLKGYLQLYKIGTI